jgi:hypothetical protein
MAKATAQDIIDAQKALIQSLERSTVASQSSANLASNLRKLQTLSHPVIVNETVDAKQLESIQRIVHTIKTKDIPQAAHDYMLILQGVIEIEELVAGLHGALGQINPGYDSDYFDSDHDVVSAIDAVLAGYVPPTARLVAESKGISAEGFVNTPDIYIDTTNGDVTLTLNPHSDDAIVASGTVRLYDGDNTATVTGIGIDTPVTLAAGEIKAISYNSADGWTITDA